MANTAELPAEHKWTVKQLKTLENLWLGKWQPKPALSNHVANEPTAIALGHRIFFDKRFSTNGQIACATCHKPELHFTDGLATAKGLADVARNTPTIVGSSEYTWLFHDGRSDSLWSQALVPLENEREHGGNRTQYAKIIYNDPVLRQDYEKLFGAMPDLKDRKRFPTKAGPVADKDAAQAWHTMSEVDRETITTIFVNLGKVLAAFENQLQPSASRFDRYVKAATENNSNEMQKQLTHDEAKGLRIFIEKGNCIICHNGPMLSDSGFHNVATPARDGQAYDWGRYSGAQQLLESPFNCRSKYNDDTNKACAELEYIVTEKDETLGSMRTPSLRNVAKTAPYMHAGQYKTLREVIKHYVDPPPLKFRLSDLFLDIDLNDAEINQLEAFLRSLDSPVNAEAHLLNPPVK